MQTLQPIKISFKKPAKSDDVDSVSSENRKKQNSKSSEISRTHPEPLPNDFSEISQFTDVKSENPNDLVPVKSRLSFFRRKYQVDIRFFAVVFIPFYILIVLLCVTAVSYFLTVTKTSTPLRICQTYECLRTATHLLEAMNQSVDPCVDFYEFTCGNWPEHHPRPDTSDEWDWFDELRVNVYRRQRTILEEESGHNSSAVKKARDLFGSCTDTETLDTIKFDDLFAYVESIGLPRVPRFFRPTDDSEPSEPLDWVRIVTRIKKTVGRDVLIGWDVSTDPTNRTINQFFMGYPAYILPIPVSTHFSDDSARILQPRTVEESVFKTLNKFHNPHDRLDRDRPEVDPYFDPFDASTNPENDPDIILLRIYVEDIIKKILGPEVAEQIAEEFDDYIVRAAQVCVEFVVEFLSLISSLTDLEPARNQSTPINYYDTLVNVAISEAQNRSDMFLDPNGTLYRELWFEYLTDLYEDTDFNVTHDTHVITTELEFAYIGKLVEFMALKDQVRVELYLWWSAIEPLLTFTTTDIIELRRKIKVLVKGDQPEDSRSMFCTTFTAALMPSAVSFPFLQADFFTETQPKVEYMIDNILQALKTRIRGSKWVDGLGKADALEKCDAMRRRIGFDRNLLNVTYVDGLYEELEIDPGRYLNNYLEITGKKFKRKLLTIREVNLETGPNWGAQPLEINAYHIFQSNAIVVPLGLLQYPFYSLGLEALNYGAIGTVLGHEIVHGFDNTGSRFDKDGNLRNWWSNETVQQYQERTECYVKQYSGYSLEEVGEYIDGGATLGENIADGEGTRDAFLAYRHYKANSPREDELLPGLQHFTKEQLFFITYGSIWCHSNTLESIRDNLENDDHSPGKIRVRGVMSNVPEFAEVFRCPMGSPMNPREKCDLWG